MNKEQLHNIRKQFPILNRKIKQTPLIYLDNAATTQKPTVVLEAIQEYYTKFNANVHRGVHTLSQEATVLMEQSREKIKDFVNAKYIEEVIFTKGTTEAINLVAYAIRKHISKNDEILISEIEHHSNIVPWQILCEQTGATLKYIPLTKNGSLDISKLDELINDKTKLVAVNHVSNALGVINPIQKIITKAHQHNAWVLIDGAQAASHFNIDVQSLNADFYVFSGHKMYAPTGVGILYGKKHILNQLDPFLGGGEMIKEVTMEKSTYADSPFRFEAGTPNIAGNITIANAIDFMLEVGLENIQQHEKELMDYATEKLSVLEEVIIYGKDVERSGSISFNIKNTHPSDVGMILDKKGIAVRTGHHCAQPIMSFYKIPGTVRASFAVYNTKEEIDEFIKAVQLSIKMLT